MINGRAYEQSELLKSGKYAVLRVGNFFSNSFWYYSNLELEPEKYCQQGDLLFAWSASFGPRIWDREKSIFHYHIWKFNLEKSVHRDFLFWWLTWFSENLRNATTLHGSTMLHLTKGGMEKELVALPPISEQIRIVAKIEELLPHLAEFDEAQSKAKSYEADFPDSLRKSILQAAVQGKLVKQDPTDEPAEVMLARLRKASDEGGLPAKCSKRKASTSAIFRGSDKRTYETRNGETVCIDDELPFDIPDNWTWTRLEAICSFIHRGKSPVYSPIRQYPVVAQKCNQWSGFSLAKAQFIDPDSISRYSDQDLLQDRDLLWNSTGLGTLGRMAIYDADANPFGFAVADSHVTVIRPLPSIVTPQYLYYYFANPTVQNVIEDLADGTTKQKELATSTVRNYLIPLPPLSEQKRIVARVEELLEVGKRLQASPA